MAASETTIAKFFFFKENTEQPPVFFPEVIISDIFLKDETFFIVSKLLENSLEITAMELSCVKVASTSLFS